MTHGARTAAWRLAARAQEIAAEIRPEIDGYVASDEILLGLLATVLVRIERAERWIEQQPALISTRGKPLPVLGDLQRWESAAARYAASLGLAGRDRSKASPTDGLAAYLDGRENGS